MSEFKKVLIFTSVTFVTYLLFNGVVSIIGQYTFRECLQSPANILALILFYWIPAITLIEDFK